MSKQEKKGGMPALRFPEFRDKGVWKEKQLQKVTEIVMGSSPKSASYNENGIGLPLLQGNADIKNRMSAPRIFTSQITKECLVEDILLSVRAPVGTVAKSIHRACIGRGISAVRACDDNIQEYLYQWLLSFEPYWKNISQGGTFDAVNSDDIRQLLAPVPDEREQQKIADCLSSIDELITVQSQKLEALKAHKNGLMQKLFPAEGETVPKLRFPEFRDAGEWEEKLFGKIIKINSGKGFKALEYSNIGIRLLQIENVGYGVTKWNKNTIFLPNSYVAEYPELVLQKGDIVLALNRPVTNNELKIARIQKDDAPSILYQRVGKISLIDGFLAIDFLFQFCKQFIKDFVIKKSIGSDQPFISLRDLYAQNILIPKPDEQQKIADCLSSIDELITAQSQKIESLKSHKKGLMQQLFPSMDEVGI